MRAFFLAAAAAFLLSACANLADRDIQREADTACRSIGALLEVLAPYRQDMPETAEATVQRIRVESDPLCTGDNPPRSDEVATRLSLMVLDLVSVQGEVN